MKLPHINTATFTGTVEKMFELERTQLGRPVLKFFLNTGKSPGHTPTGDLGEIQRCITYGETAKEFIRRVRPGAIVRVEGPLRVNSRARRHLHQRIAKIYVREATVLRPAPRAREMLERCPTVLEMLDRCPMSHEVLNHVLGPGERTEHDDRTSPTNELHLVGKVVEVQNDDVISRLTLATRIHFPATHEILFWGDVLDAGVHKGAMAEVRGLLFHHIEHWDDGQVRLVSRVHTEDLTLVDETAAPTASPRLLTPSSSSPADALRLN